MQAFLSKEKAREILHQFPQGGYMTIVQHWRQLTGGQIEFTMCRGCEGRLSMRQ